MKTIYPSGMRHLSREEEDAFWHDFSEDLAPMPQRSKKAPRWFHVLLYGFVLACLGAIYLAARS